MTAAKVMDIISRLPGCNGQAADAVSDFPDKNAPKLLKIPKLECSDIWIRLPRHKWPTSWSSKEDPVVPLGRNLDGHPLAGLSWERQSEKIVRGVSWSEVATVPKRKSHRGLDLDLSLNSEVNIRKGWKENGGTK